MAATKTAKATLKGALQELGRELQRLDGERERLLQQRESIETAPRPVSEVLADVDAALDDIADRWWRDEGHRSLAPLLGPNRTERDARDTVYGMVRAPGGLVDVGAMIALFGPLVRQAIEQQLPTVAEGREGEPLTTDQRQRQLTEIDKEIAAVDAELEQLQAEIADSGLMMALEPAELPPLPDPPELSKRPEPVLDDPPRYYGPDAGGMVRYSDPSEAKKVRPPQPTQAASCKYDPEDHTL